MRDQEFIGYLKRLADPENRDHAALAILRRGVSPSGKYRIATYRYVANWVGSNDRHWDEECLYLVAALFARYPDAGSMEGNFGESARLLRLTTESDSVERRFVALLAADAQGAPNHLRYMIDLLKARSIPLDWLALLRDLHRWKQPARFVERAWARQFWRSAPESIETSPTVEENHSA